MEKIILPELPEVLVKGIVSVKSSDLKTIVDAYNEMATIVVAQQDLITNLTNAVTECREDISKIAKILEGIYET
jgi:hypothetical protein